MVKGMRLGLTVVVGLLASGCAAGNDSAQGDTDDFIDQDVPPGNCSAGTTSECPEPGTGGSPEGGPCIDSNDCANGNCIAPFIDGQVGDFTCTMQCISLEDEGAWCVDDSSCCDAGAGAVCSTRGLCVIPESGLDESGTADGTAGDSGTGGSGTGGSGTGGSGTTGETSSSGTGAATGTTGMQ